MQSHWAINLALILRKAEHILDFFLLSLLQLPHTNGVFVPAESSPVRVSKNDSSLDRFSQYDGSPNSSQLLWARRSTGNSWKGGVWVGGPCCYNEHNHLPACLIITWIPLSEFFRYEPTQVTAFRCLASNLFNKTLHHWMRCYSKGSNDEDYWDSPTSICCPFESNLLCVSAVGNAQKADKNIMSSCWKPFLRLVWMPVLFQDRLGAFLH